MAVPALTPGMAQAMLRESWGVRVTSAWAKEQLQDLASRRPGMDKEATIQEVWDRWLDSDVRVAGVTAAPESGEVKIGNYAFPDIFGNAYFPNMSGNCPFPDEISLRWVAWAQTILLLFKSPSCLVCVKIEVNFKVLARKSTYFSVEYEDEDQNLIFVKISLLNILSPFACSKSWRTRPARPHVLPAVVRLPLPSLLLVLLHQQRRVEAVSLRNNQTQGDGDM